MEGNGAGNGPERISTKPFRNLFHHKLPNMMYNNITRNKLNEKNLKNLLMKPESVSSLLKRVRNLGISEFIIIIKTVINMILDRIGDNYLKSILIYETSIIETLFAEM